VLVLWILNFAIHENYNLRMVQDKIKEQLADASNIVNTVLTELFKEEPQQMEQTQMEQTQINMEQMDVEQLNLKQPQEK
jgi:hypothetical protein